MIVQLGCQVSLASRLELWFALFYVRFRVRFSATKKSGLAAELELSLASGNSRLVYWTNGYHGVGGGRAQVRSGDWGGHDCRRIAETV